jgi:O-antigen biosynthesis protein WbqV
MGSLSEFLFQSGLRNGLGRTSCKGALGRLLVELRANHLLVISDAIVSGACAGLAVLLTTDVLTSTSAKEAALAYVLVSTISTLIVLPALGLYRKDSRSTSVGDALALVRAAVIAVFVGSIFALALSLEPLPVSGYAIQLLALVPGWSGLRLAARHREAVRRSKRLKGHATGPTPALLVGTGPNADLFLRSLRNSNAGYRVVGIVDDVRGTQGLFFYDIEIIGSVLDAAGTLTSLNALDRFPERIFLSEPDSYFDNDGIRAILAWSEAHGIPVSQLPGLSGRRPGEDPARVTPREIAPEDVLDRPQQAVERSLLRELLKGRRVLVTGAGGSIGSELVRQIASMDPAQLILVDSCEFNAYTIEMDLHRHFPTVPRHLHIASIRDANRINEIFMRHRPELVFNAAALKHVPLVEANPCEGVLTNIIGTRNVADAAREAKAIAVVQISSDKAVNATSVMGATKRVAEFWVQAQDRISHEIGEETRFFAVRFGNVLGSSGSLIPLFQQQIQQGGPLTVTDERMERYFMTIREAVQLTLVAAAQGLAHKSGLGEIFVFDMGRPIRIVDLARRMIKLAGLEPDKDIKIKVIGTRPGEKLFEELFDDEEERRDSGIPGVASAVPAGIPMPRLRSAIHRLELAARNGDEESVRAGLRALVPGYCAGSHPAAQGDVVPVNWRPAVRSATMVPSSPLVAE